MKNFFLTLNGLFAFLFSAVAFAHPGHNHSHWSSGTIHLITLALIAIAMAVAVTWLVKKLSTNRKTKKENKSHAI